jgi:DNA-binding transcriptional LysR family regulator
MQNRRIIGGLLRSAGAEPSPTLESTSMIALFAHVRTGRWASIMPAKLAEGLGLTESVRSIPIVEPAATHAVGLVVPDRAKSRSRRLRTAKIGVFHPPLPHRSNAASHVA